MKHLHKPIFSLALASFLGLASCSQEEMLQGSASDNANPVHLTLTVNRGDAQTRTALAENESAGITSTWVTGDKLFVYDTAGELKGTLYLQPGSEGSSVGVFSGKFTGTSGQYGLWYYDDTNPCISFDSNDNAGNVLAFNNAKHPYICSVEDLASMEIMTLSDSKDWGYIDPIDIVVKDGVATNTEDIILASQLALARFSLKGITGESGTLNIYDVDGQVDSYFNTKNTRTYTEFSFANFFQHHHKATPAGITIENVDPSQDVFVAFIPGAYTLGFKFTDNDGKEYTAEFEASTTLKAGVYYNEGFDAANNSAIGAEVSFTPAETEDPETPIEYTPLPLDESELVGPVFEINGKKFRFTKSNLKYNKETGVWSLIGEQYNYLCKAGWEHSDGSWGKTEETEIDQFGYGATGLYDANKQVRAQIPTFWCESGDKGQASEAKYPTPIEEYNKGNTGSYLEKGIQFTDFDWGRAYYLSKNNEPESTDSKPYTTYDWQRDSGFELKGKEKALRYFTLTSDEWDYIVDHYYVIGATILGEPNPVLTDRTRKNNIYGLMILPIKSDEWSSGLRTKDKRDNKLPKFLEAVGADSYTYFQKADVSFTSQSAFKYESLRLTVEQFKEYEKIGAVFLPEAGYRDSQSAKTTPGYYWTSTNAQTLNATFLAFDGYSNSKVFTRYSKSRALGCSIRLVREVPANYEDPMVVY